MVSHIPLCTCKASEEFLVNRTMIVEQSLLGEFHGIQVQILPGAGNDHCHVAGGRKSSVDELVIIQQVAGAH